MKETQTEFMFNLDGLIDGNYIRVETDSKEALLKIIDLMEGCESEKK